MDQILAVRLVRTDTTLDLSQKAEKGMLDPWRSDVMYDLAGYREVLRLWVW